jgi:hypothetical protein
LGDAFFFANIGHLQTLKVRDLKLFNRQTSGESASLPQYLGCNTVFDMRLRYKLRVVTFGTKRRRNLGNVCKHRSMERSGVKCFHCTQVFDRTNLKGEMLFVNITGN